MILHSLSKDFNFELFQLHILNGKKINFTYLIEVI